MSESDRVRRAAELLTTYPFERWNYGESIGFEGLLRAADLLDERWLEGYVHGCIKASANAAAPFRELDNTIAGHALCMSFERHPDPALIEYAMRTAGHLAARQKVEGVFAAFQDAPLRAPFGGESLSPVEAALLEAPGPGVFVDCVHFDPPFFSHLGTLADEPWLVDLAAEQALAASELLQDESGLFWHFHLERTGERYGYGWGRGQGWALLGLVDLLDQLPAEHAAVEPVQEVFRRLASALVSQQNDDGGWWATVHEPESGFESSTGAFAVAGLARGIRTGVLDAAFREPANRAWARVLEELTDDGLLRNVSAAVFAATRPSHYRNVPTGFMVPWGQGPLLVAAFEIAQLGGLDD